MRVSRRSSRLLTMAALVLPLVVGAACGPRVERTQSISLAKLDGLASAAGPVPSAGATVPTGTAGTPAAVAGSAVVPRPGSGSAAAAPPDPPRSSSAAGATTPADAPAA